MKSFWVVLAIILCIAVYSNSSCDHAYYKRKPIACYFTEN